jgi:hypothetical protein
MVKLLRRLLVVVALMFWQGGFTFYASVVVPIGADTLGSHTEQGFITRSVTNWLNVAGGVALPLMAWDAAASKVNTRWIRWSRVTAWALALVTLGFLIQLHMELDSKLDIKQFLIIDLENFKVNHRVYLWTSTVQWAAGLAYLGLSLAAWRQEDQVQSYKG